MIEKDVDRLARVRDNQRKSRARKQQYVKELEQRLSVCETQAQQRDIEYRLAVQKVEAENRHLKTLLATLGISNASVQEYLQVIEHKENTTQKIAIPAVQRPDGRNSPAHSDGSDRRMSLAIPRVYDHQVKTEPTEHAFSVRGSVCGPPANNDSCGPMAGNSDCGPQARSSSCGPDSINDCTPNSNDRACGAKTGGNSCEPTVSNSSCSPTFSNNTCDPTISVSSCSPTASNTTCGPSSLSILCGPTTSTSTCGPVSGNTCGPSSSNACAPTGSNGCGSGPSNNGSRPNETEEQKPTEPPCQEPKVADPDICGCSPSGQEMTPMSEEDLLNSTLCGIADEMIERYNTKGLDVEEIRRRIWSGFRAGANGTGCRVQNSILFQVLDEISHDV
ncbi:uncharacterized protein N7511_010031 [Penicillium nucicola]|uniref:uncharacterized protein n=1 Tax=Penicillium nucicola TaxID=1850975 RepID=UPI0025450A36|nr:uncharacterized protein N7511_010031 [Penicillium nucicola]KAJ5748335.1 hypothetical protein N7511_010031 [Penicillium nucicola]